MRWLLSLTIALPSVALAASFDPELQWQSLETEHFVITFHDGEEPLAREMAVDAEVAWDKLVPEIGHAPRRKIEVVLVDWTDSANGYAQIVPVNAIVIFVTAPGADSSLGLYRDWNEAIMTHELTHILHLDTVEGLPWLARQVMGRYVSTHQVSPGWIVEGYATYQETRYTTGGRGRSATVDMVKRAAVLEDHFPPLGNMDGFQSLPPGGNLRYLFGQDFIQFIADNTNDQVWTDWLHRYGRSIPFILPAKKTFGKSLVAWHRDWKAELARRYTAQAAAITAEGLTPYRVVSPADNGCGQGSWSPDGTQLAFSCSDPHTGLTTRVLKEGETESEVLIKDKGASEITWRKDGKALAWSQSHTVKLYSSYDDVYLYDIEKKSQKLMTNGARAREPAFSPDGERLLVVTNELQNNQLAVLTVDQRLTPLTANTDHTQFSTPKYSPDGKWIAVSVWKDGSRDLWVYTADGRPFRRITWDAAIDREPSWSADGRWIFFASDRSGVPNVYAIDRADEHLWRVTNVVTGAYGPAPHPDGKRLAFQVFTTMGSQVAVLDMDPATWRDEGYLPRWAGVDGPLFPSTEVPPLPGLDPAVEAIWGMTPETDNPWMDSPAIEVNNPWGAGPAETPPATPWEASAEPPATPWGAAQPVVEASPWGAQEGAAEPAVEASPWGAAVPTAEPTPWGAPEPVAEVTPWGASSPTGEPTPWGAAEPVAEVTPWGAPAAPTVGGLPWEPAPALESPWAATPVAPAGTEANPWAAGTQVWTGGGDPAPSPWEAAPAMPGGAASPWGGGLAPTAPAVASGSADPWSGPSAEVLGAGAPVAAASDPWASGAEAVPPEAPVVPEPPVPEAPVPVPSWRIDQVAPMAADMDAVVRPYNPIPTLLPPRFWVPSAFLTSTGDSFGLFGAAATGGRDALGFFGYSAFLTWRTDAQFLGGGGSVYYNRWRPVFSASASTYVSPYGDVYREAPEPPEGGAYIPGVESTLTRYWDHRVRGSLAMGYPLSERSGLTVYYQASSRNSLDPLPEDVYIAALPTRGFFSAIGAGWSWSKGSSYALSISPERARSLGASVEITPSWLGSTTFDDQNQPIPFSQIQLTGEWREYRTAPWLKNHVFAWKLSGGATVGDRFRYGSFRLGGTFSENGITVVPSEWRMLRGFYPSSDSGEWYWLGSGEYRFPLWHIDRGVGTFPLFVKHVSGAVLVDAGNAFDTLDETGFGNTLLGVGAEVRLYTVWGYGNGSYLRGGYAFSAYGGGIPLGSPSGLYLGIGSSF